jgi:hypothetical protein
MTGWGWVILGYALAALVWALLLVWSRQGRSR